MQLALSFERDGVRALLTSDATQNGTRARRQFAPGATPARMWLDAIELGNELCARSAIETSQLERCVVTFPAAVSSEGVILDEGRFRVWRGYDLTRGLREHLRIQNVEALSNVCARARYEAHFGELQSLNSWLFVHVGGRIESWARVQGVELAGVQVGTQIIERDGALDEWGRRGSLNAYCSSEALEGRAQSYGLGGQGIARLFETAPSNFAAQSLCDDFCARLSQGLGNAAALLGGVPLCIGGSISREVWPLVYPRLEPFLKAMWPPAIPLSLFPACGDDDSALWGALS